MVRITGRDREGESICVVEVMVTYCQRLVSVIKQFDKQLINRCLDAYYQQVIVMDTWRRITEMEKHTGLHINGRLCQFLIK